MGPLQQNLSRTFQRLFDSEKSGGILLLFCTAISLLLTNSAVGASYLGLWQTHILGLSLEHWINDALMAVFFLLIGLELERELYSGELSNIQGALLPIVAAVGGVTAPALIHLGMNAGTPTQAGMGIPIATDIAFPIGIIAVLGKRIPASLRVFVVAFAVMDDLCAIVVIGLFYTKSISVGYLLGALAVWSFLGVMNWRFRVMRMTPYLLGGALMWFLMLKSGVHATLAGVMLAFAIPFSPRHSQEQSPSYRLEHLLHKPVAFVILPLFALANTAIDIGPDWSASLASPNSLGIAAGLFLGKPLGVACLCYAAVAIGLCRLPAGLQWRHILGAGMLGGVGFTMSIFIANLAFAGDPRLISASKVAILVASLAAGALGFLWLRTLAKDAGPGGGAS